MGSNMSRLPIGVLLLCCLALHTRIVPWRTSLVVPRAHVVVGISTLLEWALGCL
jgi:hypothetical protein